MVQQNIFEDVHQEKIHPQVKVKPTRKVRIWIFRKLVH